MKLNYKAFLDFYWWFKLKRIHRGTLCCEAHNSNGDSSAIENNRRQFLIRAHNQSLHPFKEWGRQTRETESKKVRKPTMINNTPPGAKLGLCRRTIYSKLSTSGHNLFQIFLRESKFFFEHQIFLSWPFLNIWNYQTLSLSEYLFCLLLLTLQLPPDWVNRTLGQRLSSNRTLVLREKFGFSKKNLE